MGDDSEWEATQQRRMRTKFSSEQVRKLENAFGRHNYLGTMQRRRIAEKLNLSETQVGLGFHRLHGDGGGLRLHVTHLQGCQNNMSDS